MASDAVRRPAAFQPTIMALAADPMEAAKMVFTSTIARGLAISLQIVRDVPIWIALHRYLLALVVPSKKIA